MMYMWIGTEDVLYLHGKEMAEVIPNCSCTEYPGLGHVSTVLEKAEDIIKKLMT